MHFARLVVTGYLIAFCTAAFAQYPVKPIKLVVSFPAGSATDSLARLVSVPMAKSLGQPIIVENKPGADGAIGALHVAKSPPDGYTLLAAVSANLSAVPALRKQPPYDPINDFSPVSLFGHYSFLVLVNASVPAKTLGELIAYARQNPGKLNYATGNGTGVVGTAHLKMLAGIDMLHVPYKGEPAAITDLVSGRVDLMIGTTATTLPFIKSGKLRALATTNKTRTALAPDVPTIAEAGLPGYSMDTFAALVGPAGLPKSITDMLAAEVAAVLRQPEVKEGLDKQGFRYASASPEETAAYIKSQLDIWGRIIRDSNIPKD